MTRKISAEGSLSLKLFLRESGLIWGRLPGAAKGTLRFGGATEPLVWSTYQLYQSHSGLYVKEVEVREDFWPLRENPVLMMTALRWARWLERFLLESYPYDNLLGLFYWAMDALQRRTSPEPLQARFLWRWLQSWGIAPDLFRCSGCGGMLNGKGFFNDGAFFCPRCSCGEADLLELESVIPYVMAPRFLPVPDSQELRRQSINLSNCLLKSLESYR